MPSAGHVGDAARVAWLLLAAVAGLLLIACVNVANLILARMTARNREFAVRSALGAGRARLARLALTESLLLAVTGGGLGLPLAAALLRVFVQLAPSSIPEINHASLDLRVFSVASVLALAVGAAVGIWPALSVLRNRAVQYGARATAAARPSRRTIRSPGLPSVRDSSPGCRRLLPDSPCSSPLRDFMVSLCTW